MKNASNSGISPDAARGLGTTAAAVYTGLSVSFLEKARVNQTEIPGPSFIRVGRRCIYLRDQLDSYLENFPSD
jgi:hypothetical protein